VSARAVRRDAGGCEPAELGEDLGAILDALPAMVGYWDVDLHNRFANRAYVEFLGLRKCLRRVYGVLQAWRPGVGASRLSIRPTIAHLTIATEVLVRRS